MNIQQALNKVLKRENLSSAEMQAVMRSIMTGETTRRRSVAFWSGCG